METVLRTHYGLLNATCQPMELGAVNLNLRVEAGGALYVLKRYARGTYPGRDIKRSVETQMLLHRAGLPVPPIIPNREGSLITEAEGTSWVLHGFVSGRHFPRNLMPPAAAIAMGETHARILRALGAITLVATYTIPTPAEAIANLERLLALAEQRTDAVDLTAAQVLRYKIAAVERLAPLVDAMRDLPVQWVHGDYQDTNVLFGEGDQVVGVLDFDNLRCRPRGYDVMRCFDYSFPQVRELGYAYFRGFAREYRPAQTEVAAYAPLWAYTAATRDWPLDTRYLAPETYQERWDRFITPPSGWWEENWQAVSERLLTVALTPTAARPRGPHSPGRSASVRESPTAPGTRRS